MPDATTPPTRDRPRVGAVSYLNSKPLVEGLAGRLPGGLVLDYPSRLAASLAAGDLDVALIPSVEVLRSDGAYEIVSDACVAARGPVRSVKVYFRVPPGEVRTLALDEGSRTSATLARVLLLHKYGVEPKTEPLPLSAGCPKTLPTASVEGWPGRSGAPAGSESHRSGAEEPLEPATLAPDCGAASTRGNSSRPGHPWLAADAIASTSAEAILLIGDRAMFPVDERFVAVWDLGEEWFAWTGLPFVFAAWAGRRGGVPDGLAELLSATRDRGVASAEAIARREAAALGLDPALALDYLRRNLHFTLGPAERSGLKLFRQLAHQAGLVPGGTDLVYRDRTAREHDFRRGRGAHPAVAAKWGGFVGAR